MGEVLYEAAYRFDPFLLIPVVLFVFISIFPKIAIKTYQESGKWSKEKYASFVKTFCLIFKIFAVFFICIILVTEIVSYKQTVVAYKEGNYKTVEGYVENYSPMPYAGHSVESFTVDGVGFSYSDYTITQGYHNAASHGGVITHDGQRLKIGYIVKPFLQGNVIVYIEELPQ